MDRKVLALRLSWIFFSVFFFLGLLPAGKGQELSQTVRGKVIDQDLKKPLYGAQVRIIGTQPVIGDVTGEDGTFRLDSVPVGKQDLKVTYLGYEPRILRNVQVTAGKEVVLTIGLVEKVYETEEVVIEAGNDKAKPKNELATISARQFTTEETDRYAGSRGDPARMAANYAGVSAASDARNDIIVRGNSPVGLLWRLEGIDIPNPNHFSTQGATGGPISILNNNLLQNSDFMSSAFPAEYGNKVAAVFDLEMRKGNNETMEYTGQAGINGFEAGIEGPISKEQGSSFLVNYRYSTLEAFDRLGIDFGVSGIPKYQDLSFKVDLPTENAGHFKVFGMGGKSDLELLDSDQDPSDWSFTDQGEDLVFGSDMGTIGVSNRHFLDSNTYARAGLALNASRSRATIDTISPQTQDPYRVYKYNGVNGDIQGHYTVTHKVNARHKIKSGLRYKQLFFDQLEKAWNRRYQRYIRPVDNEDMTGLAQTFLHWRFRMDEFWTLNAGLHYQRFLLNDTKSLEPRVGLSYDAGKTGRFSLGYGLHSQTQILQYYYMRSYDPARDRYIQTNKDLGMTRAHHMVAGYDKKFGKHFRIKSEAYYQRLFNVPVDAYKESSFSMLNTGAELEGLPQLDSLKNTGTGRNYGVDLTVEKFFSDQYYFLVTGSLYESFYKGSDGVERPTRFNGNYLLNVLGGREFHFGGPDKVLDFNVKYAYTGGNRYTPIDLKASRAQGEEVRKTGKAFSKQYKPYMTLDLKLEFRLDQKDMTQEIFFTVENVTDRLNVLRKIYVPETGKIKKEYQLGLFPYGGYRITF